MGVIYGSTSAYSVMVQQGFGQIVNTASLAGLIASPGLTPYSATKSAVVALSLALRAEGAALGVRVSVVCPGFKTLDHITGRLDRVELAATVHSRLQSQNPESPRKLRTGRFPSDSLVSR